MKRYAIVVAALACALAAVGIATAAGSDPVVTATLTGRAEIPKGSPTGSGSVMVNLNTKTGKTCWVFHVRGLDKLLSAHIHRGKPGKTGPVVIPLGATFVKTGCVQASKKSVRAVAKDPAGFYVNVHTKKYLNGAIRGQLRLKK
jgi:CHRD domain